MSQITASTVKDLREKTGAGMMDCKRALDEAKGDMEAAVDWLRKKGLSAAAKKSGRVAAEGLVSALAEGKAGVLVEVNAETDFVARNEQFQAFAKKTAEIALSKKGDIDTLKDAPYGNGKTVQDELTSLIATVGENMNLRRVASLSVDQGVVVSYVHAPLMPGLGKIGVLVALESTGEALKLATLGKQLAMHVAAARPEALTVAEVKAESLERERNILTEQAIASGKAPEHASKMVEGRIRKYYEEVVLLEQVFVIDGETKIAKVVENAAKEIGAPVRLAGFVRFGLGEGIEREQGDFAAEVAATLGQK
jgi:elongation factor Ts